MRIATLGLTRLSPAALVGLLLAAPAPAQNAPPKAGGLYFTLQNPINEGQRKRIQSEIDAARTDARRNVKKVIFDFNPDGKEAATESFGPCADLADYIKTLASNGITTIAFVHGKTVRHSVLPALACDDLIMAAGSQIGQVAGGGANVNQVQSITYATVAGINRAGPVARMFDKDVKLVQAQYQGATIYVDQRKVEGPNPDPGYAEVRVGNRTPVHLPPGTALYSVEEARKFGLCKLQKDTIQELLDWYELPPETLNDGGGIGAMKPVRVLVEGQINTALREKVRRQVEAAKARKENMFFFVLETTPGGDLPAARGLADDLIALGKDPDYRARTVAFIPGRAPDLAVFLALACHERVMYLGTGPENEAVLGEFDALLGPGKGGGPNVKFIRLSLEDVAQQTAVNKLIVDGLFEPNLTIYRARNNKTGERQVMSGDELAAKPKGEWATEATIKDKGVLLKLTASRAQDLRLAKGIDNKDISEAYALYGVEAKDVRASEPSWLDDFAAFLRQTHVSILLVVIGIAGLVLEMKAPGLVIPGVVAAVCFILFFWAQTQLGGQLIYLAIMLFLLGLALLGVEIFLIPGFGVTGVSGILLILAGLVLAGLDKAPESAGDWADIVGKLLRYGLTMAGSVILAFLLSRFLPKIPYANRLMLVPPEDKPEAGEELPSLPGAAEAVSLLGQVGTATSMLRPSGLAKFGDRYVDVVTEGEFISPGTPIQVVEVEGTRIVVKGV